MRVKRTKNNKVFSYSGDLKEERMFLLWQFQKAKKAHEAYEQRIADLKSFIELAEAEMKKWEGNGENA